MKTPKKIKWQFINSDYYQEFIKDIMYEEFKNKKSFTKDEVLDLVDRAVVNTAVDTWFSTKYPHLHAGYTEIDADNNVTFSHIGKW